MSLEHWKVNNTKRNNSCLLLRTYENVSMTSVANRRTEPRHYGLNKSLITTLHDDNIGHEIGVERKKGLACQC